MTDTKLFRAAGQSRLAQFVDVLMGERDLFDKALERDASALKVLSGPGLSVAVGRVDRLKELHKYGRREQRKWTRRDQEKFAWLHGWRDGGYPQGRVELLLQRHSSHNIDRRFRAALDEAQRDRTADAVSPALSGLLRAHKSLRAMAYDLSQREPPGDDKSPDWGEVYARQSEALNEVIPFCPAPAKQEKGSSNNWWYEVDEKPPEKTKDNGPLAGTKQELGVWISGKDVKNNRTLEQKAKRGIVWVRRLRGQGFEAFFQTRDEYARVNQAMIAAQRPVSSKAKRQKNNS